MGDSTCNEAGCDKPEFWKFLCIRHYGEQISAPLRGLRSVRSGCEEHGCDAKHHSKGYCRDHFNARRRSGLIQFNPKKNPPAGIDGSVDRWCYRCQEIMPLNNFTGNRGGPGGKSRHCRACTSTWNRMYIKANPEAAAARSRKARIKRIYGITWQERDKMVERQDGRCMICQIQFADRRDVQVDHCHSTGKVRDILCMNCNMGLGSFKDNVASLQAAITYLQRHATS